MLSKIDILCVENLATTTAADVGILRVHTCTTDMDLSARSARSAHATG